MWILIVADNFQDITLFIHISPPGTFPEADFTIGRYRFQCLLKNLGLQLETFLGELAPITHLAIPPAKAVAPYTYRTDFYKIPPRMHFVDI